MVSSITSKTFKFQPNQAYFPGILSDQEAKTAVQDHTQWCNQHYDMMEKYEPSRSNLQGKWSTMAEPGAELTTWNTGIATDLLKYVGAQCVSIPDDFVSEPKTNRITPSMIKSYFSDFIHI